MDSCAGRFSRLLGSSRARCGKLGAVWAGRRWWHCACVLVCLTASAWALSGHRGQVTFNGLPVPGATVTATQDGNKFVTVTDQQGSYSFPELKDGSCTIEVEMPGFATVRQEITVAPSGPAQRWELKMLPLAEIKAKAQTPAVATASAAAPAVPQSAEAPNPQPAPAQSQESDDLNQSAADGFLINGSVNNAATAPFALPAAFGNNRNGGKSLYNGGLGVLFDNSALDARPYSLSGQNTPKAAYSRLTGFVTLGGPLQIPHLIKNGPFFFVAYQWTRNNNATAQSALVPTQAEREGRFSTPVIDPLTGSPFPGNLIPAERISPQARALLNLYPLPNVSGSARYNYQAPILSPTHQDALQTRLNKNLSANNQLYGGLALQSTRASTANVFGFVDTTEALGLHTNINWTHRLRQQLFLNLGYQFSRLSNRVHPFFENRTNISGQAGITGNNQDAMNWGPPTLEFSSGVAGLSDSPGSFNRNQTSAVSYSLLWNHRAHNVSLGGDFRRQEFNFLAQQDARGTLTFTGAVTGSALGDFLLGIPQTSSIAFGNADKYFRQSVYDAYVADDWRVTPSLTLNLGLRWEYSAPITELHDRLVNLDIAPGFVAAAPVLASDATGTLTGSRYPNSLVHPDKTAFEPRLGLAWRPLPGSSLLVRAGYGIYYDASGYQTIALQMAQQPPLSKTFSVQNSAADPLTLANAFTAPAAAATNTFAVDPNFRVGYAQIWQLSVQHDLPGSLQLTAAYIGTKGTHGLRAFLPNTFPAGGTNPCPTCPAGFVYLTSSGNLTRQAAQVQLRRRLHSGLAAVVRYTFAKSIDDVAAAGGLGSPGNNQNPSPQAPGGASPGALVSGSPTLAIAQNWLNLRAERGLSAFDQRHLLTVQLQYTTGTGMAGGTLLRGWRGTLFKEWTVATQITAGSGLPQTPIYLAPVPGTGVTGTIRPKFTGAPLYDAPSGLFLNPAAYAPPPPGQWGDAGRDSITGPAQFTLNASLGRTFRVGDRFNLDLRLDATNALNHVTYTAWNTTINSAQFGLPAAANAMRSVQSSLRLRF